MLVNTMERQIPSSLVEQVKNKEEVRIYRLHLLEENQVKILNKIDELESSLNENYTKRIKELEERVALLEKGFKDIEHFKWIVIAETIAVLGFILQTLIK